tara:strand:- start:9 stop:2348 length:2340 start_codon:yes stop_codon:yes gene_type:complete
MDSIKDKRPKFFASIPHEYILVDKSKKPAIIIGIGKKWTIEDALIESQLGKPGKICCNYDLTQTNYAVIDIDEDGYSLDDLGELCDVDSASVPGNTKGHHVWVEFKEGQKPSSSNVVDCFKGCKGDYLGEKVFERFDKDWVVCTDYDDNPLQWMDNKMMDECFDMKMIVKVKNPKEKNDKVYEPSDNETLEKICDLISPSCLEDRKGYLCIMSAMKNSGLSREYALEFSKRSPKFDVATEMYGINTPEDFDNFWNYDGLPHEGLLRKLAKLSNPKIYEELTNKDCIPIGILELKTLEKGALCVANVICSRLKEQLIYCNDIWYTIDKKTHLWKTIKKPSCIVVSTIHSFLNDGISILYDKLRNTNPEDNEARKNISNEIKFYSTFYSKCDSAGYLSNMFNHLTDKLRDDDFVNKLDYNPAFIAYQNGILDINTLKFREGLQQSDYITQTIPHDYEEATKEQIDFVEDIILKICNNNEKHKEYYLACLGFAMLGKPHLQKAIYFLVGQGGDNGKTLILDSLAEIAPCYIKKIERKAFEQNYTKAHKHLKNIRGKRIVYIEELPKGKKMNIELLKEYGDGKSIENEIMFGTDESITILSKLFALSNHTPSFEVDGGVSNRYRQIQFTSNFGRNNKENSVENGIHYYIQDRTLADKLQGEYKHALLGLLIKWAANYEKNGMPDIPKMFVDEAEQTLSMNDGFATWFNDNCVIETGVKIGKEELHEASGYKTKDLNDELKRMGYSYDKTLRVENTKVRGGWRGFKISNSSEPEDDNVDELEQQ